ncbi:MAG TPA: branched-chain amino acid ABC transporter permease [Candidatus Dietzia intestinipullorum]|nr:branched-chain amino acid ABC transporter permease [Candidatus Dietzia merdigallinarum]HJC28671.1 branched-chain amino acid ABC transporter permease [Candidatus Dietzia intestinipullorum]
MTTVWQGLVLGSLYALIATGYNIVLLSAGMVNFAYATFLMVGTYAAFVVTVEWDMPWPLGVLIGAAFVAVLSLLMERIALRKLIAQHRHLTALIVTIGVSQILEGVAKVIFGDSPRSVPTVISSDTIRLFGGIVRPSDLLLIVVVVAVVVLLHLTMTRTMVGLGALASAEDPDAAGARGINARGIGMGAFALSGAVAGGIGLFVAGNTYADANLGHSLAVLGIVAVVIGGAGNQLGGLVGGFIAGLLSALAGRYLGAEYAQVAVFVLLLMILLVKPGGFFGAPAQRTV